MLGKPSAAGMLVEGKLQNVPIRLEVGRDPNLVRAKVAHSERLIDLKAERIFHLGRSARAVDLRDRPDPTSRSRYDLTYWGGKRLTVAGEKGGYYVLTLQDTTCGEALVASWTRPLIAPLVAAVDLLQRSEPDLRPTFRKACGTIPFRAYALQGWPLLAGWIDARVFETSLIDMAYQPDEARFLRP
jgi:hypothetical protein